jgi:lipopolysaccharide transport system permease protein
MNQSIQQLYSHRELLWMWTVRELKIRYKQSVLGVAWAVLQPLALMLVFTVVFSYFAKVPTSNIPYPVFSLTGVLPWTFFSTAVSFAVPSLVTNLHLVTKIYFPREVLPISSVFAAFIDFLIECVVFIVVMIIYRMPVYSSILWLPLILLIQIVFMIGLVISLSALNVWFRDIRFIIPLALQIWMYACPIIYPVNNVPESVRWLYMLNPMAAIIDSYQRIILYGVPPQGLYLAIAAAISLLILFFGYRFFKRSEVNFSDVI